MALYWLWLYRDRNMMIKIMLSKCLTSLWLTKMLLHCALNIYYCVIICRFSSLLFAFNNNLIEVLPATCLTTELTRVIPVSPQNKSPPTKTKKHPILLFKRTTILKIISHASTISPSHLPFYLLLACCITS